MSRGAALLARLHHIAERGWSGTVVFGWGLLQGSVLPGPADVVYAPLAAAHRHRALRLALLAAAGSIVGGIIAYGIGTQLSVMREASAIGRVLGAVGITPAALAPWRERVQEWGWALVLLATVSPLSTKLVCIAAGAFGVAPVPFLAALAAGRTARTTTIAWLASRAGDAYVRATSAREQQFPPGEHAHHRERQERDEHERRRDR
ncbi:MAG: hypothetical protein MUF00_14115 [Gemmatimonadaceae bacterium]|jgi:membrane protein YqaA with SNARE-associated domain|nr:hypothetical protein [Gemmatimonadaceae bacterium]